MYNLLLQKEKKKLVYNLHAFVKCLQDGETHFHIWV